MCLRRGFTVTAGQRILIAEDVVTTGKSTRECAAVLEAEGAEVVGAVCIVDRSAAGEAAGAALPYPLYAGAAIAAANWDAADCVLCKQGIPAVKPGTRKIF
jgi:orotate phosphoribosyltransferase